jgi:hypothetical protein
MCVKQSVAKARGKVELNKMTTIIQSILSDDKNE